MSPPCDKPLQDAKILIMRSEGSPYLEVEETDLSKALELLPDAKQYSQQFVVHEGLVTSEKSYRSIGSTVRIMWEEIAIENKALIRLNNQNGGHSPHMFSEGEYNVHLYSVPSDPFKESGVPPAQYLGYLNFGEGMELQRGSDHELVCFDSSGIRGGLADHPQDFEFLEDEAGNIFAIYTPFNAWITIKCGRDEDMDFSEDARATLKAQFQRLFEGMNALTPNLSEFMEEQETLRRHKTLEAWSALVAGRHDDRVKETKVALEGANDKLIQKRKEMVEILREIPNLEAVIRIAQEVRPDTTALANEFDQIHTSPWVDRIEIDDAGEAMTVYTHTLVMDGDEDIRSNYEDILKQWAGKMVPIGKFMIRLTASGEITVENLTNQKEGGGRGENRGWDHPHIPAGGSPCWGTIERSLPMFLAKYEFAGAMHLLIAYLTCCDADDAWGRNIFLWEEDAYPKGRPSAPATETEATAA